MSPLWDRTETFPESLHQRPKCRSSDWTRASTSIYISLWVTPECDSDSQMSLKFIHKWKKTSQPWQTVFGWAEVPERPRAQSHVGKHSRWHRRMLRDTTHDFIPGNSECNVASPSSVGHDDASWRTALPSSESSGGGVRQRLQDTTGMFYISNYTFKHFYLTELRRAALLVFTAVISHSCLF